MATGTAFVLGEFHRHGGGWKFRAVGQGYASGPAGLATDFGIAVEGAVRHPRPRYRRPGQRPRPYRPPRPPRTPPSRTPPPRPYRTASPTPSAPGFPPSCAGATATPSLRAGIRRRTPHRSRNRDDARTRVQGRPGPARRMGARRASGAGTADRHRPGLHPLPGGFLQIRTGGAWSLESR
ncbi:TerD family protein [Streptomyces enissocaesilis]|uniref:TerD family protein n=1 Tax=Streptomyces enissocaesilis TaxID=332589 RepID=UPI003CD09CAC